MSAGAGAQAAGSPGRVLVTPRSLTAQGLDAVAELEPLRAAGHELVSGPPGRLPEREELLVLVPGCVGWLAGVEAVGADVLAAADGLRVISRNGTGTDAIDLAAAERAGVVVERAAGANAQGVAELALALSLSALRHVPTSAAALRRGEWQRRQGLEVGEAVVGLVGLGAVGRLLAGMVTALGGRVVAHDPYAAAGDVELVALEELVGRSDVISLHAPPPPGGRPLVDAPLLARVRPGAALVNTARAALVDDAAVLAALEDGVLSTYAVDAFDVEPPPVTDLLRHERVVATPHVGGYTGASVRRATEQAVANLLTALAAPPAGSPE